MTDENTRLTEMKPRIQKESPSKRKQEDSDSQCDQAEIDRVAKKPKTEAASPGPTTPKKTQGKANKKEPKKASKKPAKSQSPSARAARTNRKQPAQYRCPLKPQHERIVHDHAFPIFEVSAKVEMKKLILTASGAVTDYNFSQMSAVWMKTFINKLIPVLQLPSTTVRGRKQTLLHGIMQANVPDDEDLELERQLRDLQRLSKMQSGEGNPRIEPEARTVEGAPVSPVASDPSAEQRLSDQIREWEPRWRCSPIFEMLVIRDVFEDSKCLLVRLSTTDGDLLTRTHKDAETWKVFLRWLREDQAKMCGFRLRRDGEWRGFGVEMAQLGQYEGLEEQVRMANEIMEERGCASIWVTKVAAGAYDGVEE